MELNATFFGNEFVTVCKQPQARRSYKGGVSVGVGHVPFDTGALQNSIRLARKGERQATVYIGGNVVRYAQHLQYGNFAGRGSNRPNRHKGFVQRIVAYELAPHLAKKLRAKVIVS